MAKSLSHCRIHTMNIHEWDVNFSYSLSVLNICDYVTSFIILGCSKEFGQRLPWNIGLLLRKLWVVVCFHSRRLTICKHSCVRHISWAFCSAISGKQTMFTKWFVNMVCLPLIAERNAHEICLTQECLQIVRHLFWKQTTTHSIRNNNPMFDGNLLLSLYVRLSMI